MKRNSRVPKSIKRSIALGILALLCLSLTAACGAIESIVAKVPEISAPVSETKKNDNDSANDSSKAAKEKFKYGRAEDYIKSHLTGDYSVTYAYSISEMEGPLESTVTRTEEGYYISIMGMELLLIKNGDTYDQYYPNGENGFKKVDFLDPVTEKEVEKELFGMGSGNFMRQYDLAISSDLENEGTEKIVGRNCDKYSSKESNVAFAYKYTYWIDQETGVCMKYSFDLAAKDLFGGISFECTEFKTSDVSLPEYY